MHELLQTVQAYIGMREQFLFFLDHVIGERNGWTGPIQGNKTKRGLNVESIDAAKF